MKYFILLITTLLFFQCRHVATDVTGWDYNDPRNGGFQKVPFLEQETAPGMRLIEGGSKVLIKNEKPDTLLVPSFYMAKHEETNEQYLSYLNFLKKYYSKATYESALPDTNIWRLEKLDKKVQEYRVNNYLRNPKYKNHPVVGVSPHQIEKYAQWKTDRLNEIILIREGIINFEKIEDTNKIFSTNLYLVGDYNRGIQTPLPDLNPSNYDKKNKLGERRVRMEDGLLLPKYRIPTYSEWKWANLCIGDSSFNFIKTQKPYKFPKKIREHALNYFVFQKEEKKFENIRPNSVFSLELNNHLITGINSNTSEIVLRDTSKNSDYVVTGGSTKGRTLIYTSTYNKDSMSYSIPNEFEEPFIFTKPKAAIGFRLAMDRVGSPRGFHYKRKKKYLRKGK